MEYLGAYRNHGDQGQRFQSLVGLPSLDRSRSVPEHYRRTRRLTAAELDQLVAGYHAGRSVYQLGREFGINRKTVAELLRRRGVELRYRALTDGQIAEAVRLHAEGWSFVRLGERYGVNQSTVWAALERRRHRPEPSATA